MSFNEGNLELGDREAIRQMQALKEYCNYGESIPRSVNVDDTNRTKSVAEEHEANKVGFKLTKIKQCANNIWADIYRNKYLVTVQNPPSEMTPDIINGFHPNIKMTKKLEDLFQPIRS